MALMQIKNAGTVGLQGATCAGITDITQASAEISANTVVRAKDSAGEVKAILVGKKLVTLSASGYATSINGPALGAAITVGGVTGKIVSASIECSAEDFTKFSAEGRSLSFGNS
jgi:hypothetical protein